MSSWVGEGSPPLTSFKDSLLLGRTLADQEDDDEEELIFDHTSLLNRRQLSSEDENRSSLCSRFVRCLLCCCPSLAGSHQQVARTFNLCLSFFALGLCFAIPTATLDDLQKSVDAGQEVKNIYTARYSGYLFGAFIGGFLFDRYNRQFLLFLSLLATGVGILVMPFCRALAGLMACTAITGITMGFLDTGGNVWCLDLWGRRSGPVMQGMHFCFGLGAFLAPLVAEPFLTPHPSSDVVAHDYFGGNTMLHPGSHNSSVLLHVPSVGLPHTSLGGHHPLSKPQFFNSSKEAFVRHRRSPVLSDLLNSTSFEQASANVSFENFTAATSDGPTEGNVTSDAEENSKKINDTGSSTAAPVLTTSKLVKKKPLYADGNMMKEPDRWQKPKKDRNGNIISEAPPTKNTTASPATTGQATTKSSVMPNSTLYVTDTEPTSAGNLYSLNGTSLDFNNETEVENFTAVIVDPEKNLQIEQNVTLLKNDTSSTTVDVSTASSLTSGISTGRPSTIPPPHAPSSTSPLTSPGPFTSSLSLSSSSSQSTMSSLPSFTSTSSPFTSVLNPNTTPISAGSSSLSPTSSPSSPSSLDPVLPSSISTTPTTVVSTTATVVAAASITTVFSKATTSKEQQHPLLQVTRAYTTAADYTSPSKVKLQTEVSVFDAQDSNLTSKKASVYPKLGSFRNITDNLVSQSASSTDSSKQEASTVVSNVGRTLNPSLQPTVTPENLQLHPSDLTESDKMISSKLDSMTPTDKPLEDARTTESISNEFKSQNNVVENITTKRISPVIADAEQVSGNSADEKEGGGEDVKTEFSAQNSTKATKKQSDILGYVFELLNQNKLGRFEIPYVLLSVYIFFVAILFLVFLCRNPRELRSKQEEELDHSWNPSGSFQMTMVGLMVLFFCLYVGMEVAVGQLLETFATKEDLQLSRARGYFLPHMFWGSFAVARGLSVCVAMQFSGRCMLLTNLSICLVASVMLVAGADKLEALLWIGIVLLGLGMAPLFPTAISWIECYLRVTNKMASVFIVGAAVGEIVLPTVISVFINEEPMVLMYVNILVNTLCFACFLVLCVMASRHSIKYAHKPSHMLYQLASTEESEEIGTELALTNAASPLNGHVPIKRKTVQSRTA